MMKRFIAFGFFASVAFAASAQDAKVNQEASSVSEVRQSKVVVGQTVVTKGVPAPGPNDPNPRRTDVPNNSSNQTAISKEEIPSEIKAVSVKPE